MLNRKTHEHKFFDAPYGCFWIAALGLALEGAAGEFRKFAPAPEFSHSSLDSLLARLLVLVLVVAVFFIARKWDRRFVFRNRIWATAVCVSFSVGLALYFSGFLFVASNRLFVVVGYYITSVVGSLYFLIWFDRIFAFGIRGTLLTVAASLILRGLIEMVLVLMQQTPDVVILTAMPLASLPCFLRVFAQTEALEPDAYDEENLKYSVASPTKIRYSKLAMVTLFLMLFLIPLVTFVSDEHIAQITTDLGLSWYRQGSCIGVNIVVGGLLFLFANLHFNKTMLVVYFLVVTSFTATAVFTVQMGSSPSMLTGSLALQAAKKMLDFGAVFPAFIFSTDGRKCYHRHVAGRMCSFGGRAVALFPLWSASADSALRGVLDGGLFFLLFATLIVFFFCLESVLPEQAGAAADGAGSAAGPEDARAVAPQPFREAVAQLAAEGHLTPTEEAILALIARGNNAESVSRELSVSVNTAKTHIRNIHTKLYVHSQQEIIAKVNAVKDEIKSSFEE